MRRARRALLTRCGRRGALGLCRDLTTTFPVDIKFSSQARALYQVLYRAFEVAKGALRPGVRFKDVHLATSEEIAKGLIALGIMKGDPHEAVAAGAHALFFPHGLGHQLASMCTTWKALGKITWGMAKNCKEVRNLACTR